MMSQISDVTSHVLSIRRTLTAGPEDVRFTESPKIHNFIPTFWVEIRGLPLDDGIKSKFFLMFYEFLNSSLKTYKTHIYI